MNDGEDIEEDEVEDDVQDGEKEDQMESDEELPDTEFRVGKKIGGSYVIAMYEGQWFLAQVCFDQANVKKVH